MSQDHASSVRTIKMMISVVVVLLLIAKPYWPDLTPHAIVVGLLIVAVLPWLARLIKSVELSGGSKIVICSAGTNDQLSGDLPNVVRLFRSVVIPKLGKNDEGGDHERPDLLRKE